jgi:23S rRNA (adenine2503-C2)-methyltransferase
MQLPTSLYDLDLPDLETEVNGWGEAHFRISQVWEGLYKHFWHKPEEFTTLPGTLRQRLADTYSPFTRLDVKQVLQSDDKETIKTLFRLPDGQAIEAVLMRYDHRKTICISTQAGCAMGCVFCATGHMGFRRHLSSGEIVEQVIYYARLLRDQGDRLTNVVIMGMGEPFHNYESTMTAIDRLNHPRGFNFGERRFTISTVGLVPLIQRFTAEKRQVNLAVSLHAADDELRSSMLPINRRYPLDELLKTCRDYVNKSKRRISFEWALIQGINDTPEQARLLAKRLKGMLCHVNVIPLNTTERYKGQATTRQRAIDFQSELEKWGIPCTIRLRRGIDIQAGCGQLAIQSEQITDSGLPNLRQDQ